MASEPKPPLQIPPKVTCGTCQRAAPYHSMYRCFQCQRWFDEQCMAQHLTVTHNVGGDRAESTAPASPVPSQTKVTTEELTPDAIASALRTFAGTTTSREAWTMRYAAAMLVEQAMAIRLATRARSALSTEAEPSEDTARLDWLEARQPDVTHVAQCSNYPAFWAIDPNEDASEYMAEGFTLREAVDSARSSSLAPDPNGT